MPEYNASGNPISDHVENVTFCEDLEKIKDALDGLKKQLDNLNKPQEFIMTFKLDKNSNKNKETKLPKKLRNGWA